ncbi:hypothetical protein MAR_022969 [Mya arenaria]|uniref:Uncharacterized protein n=1 Tax=Mya arenaria TaxID=6604 RepID=A0ABY7DLM7_MYAAR|nr:hypothetical protein MAR_022969 [Mya arenaria]
MTRYGKTNNKYMGDEFDPKKYISGCKQSVWMGHEQASTTSGLEWMSESELDDWKPETSILVSRFRVSRRLDLHNDYPLAPEQVTVNKVEKLIPNLNNKTK